MATDEAMLEAHLAGDTLPTLRVYGWRPPAVSLGRFQPVESSVDLGACRRSGVEVVRRPTGGRAILHTPEEITFSLVVSSQRLGTSGVMEAYRSLARGIVAAMRVLGLEARLVERAALAPPGAARDPACFAVKARCDLVVGSAKLVGSAQVQRQGVILQQNSLPLLIRVQEWPAVFRRTDRAPEAVGLCDAAGREVSYEEAAAALRQGFASAFGIRFQKGVLTEREATLAQALLAKAVI
jgi:lipoate-protein ligase A